MEVNHSELVSQLKQHKLTGMLQTLPARQHQAEAEGWSFGEFMSRLLEDEIERRAQSQLTARIKKAGLKVGETLEGFDWNFNPQIKRQQLLRLAGGEYIRAHQNVLLVGPTGTGIGSGTRQCGLPAGLQRPFRQHAPDANPPFGGPCRPEL